MPEPSSHKPNLLVTLSDRNYLDAAKQVFSSAYHKAGWRGDYMLLAHELSEADTQWFRARGILVRDSRPPFGHGVGGMPPVLISKFHLFKPEFRQWKSVIYVDADSTIRASLDTLTDLDGFHSVLDWNPILKLQIVGRGERRRRSVPRATLVEGMRLLSTYDLSAPAFCAGFFAFAPTAIADDAFPALVGLAKRFGQLSRFGDQLAMNLYFYGRWQRLSPIYHLTVLNGRPPWPLRVSRADAMILHFAGAAKPWKAKGMYFEEWSDNLSKAQEIDLRAIPEGMEWSAEKVELCSRYLTSRLALNRLLKRYLAPIGGQ